MFRTDFNLSKFAMHSNSDSQFGYHLAERKTVMREQTKSPFEKKTTKWCQMLVLVKQWKTNKTDGMINLSTTKKKQWNLPSNPIVNIFRLVVKICNLCRCLSIRYFGTVVAAILDLSKLSLYGFHYNEMKPRKNFGDVLRHRLFSLPNWNRWPLWGHERN